MPRVRIPITLPGITRDPAIIDFVVDSGSARTCLHPRDAIRRAGIARSRLLNAAAWPNRVEAVGVGGAVVYAEVAAEYGFGHTDGRVHVYPGQILIAFPRPENQQFDWLLGWDILQLFAVTLDWPAGVVTLTERSPLVG